MDIEYDLSALAKCTDDFSGDGSMIPHGRHRPLGRRYAHESMHIGYVAQAAERLIASRQASTDKKDVDRSVVDNITLQPIVGATRKVIAPQQFDFRTVEARFRVRRRWNMARHVMHSIVSRVTQKLRGLKFMSSTSGPFNSRGRRRQNGQDCG